MKVLILTSVDPLSGSGRYALPYYRALKEAGMEVDLVTRYPVKGCPEFHYAENPEAPRLPFFKRKWEKWRNRRLRRMRRNIEVRPNPYGYTFADDRIPPLAPYKLTRAIPQKEYDVIMPVFWEGMISYATLLEVCRKVKGKLLLNNVDFQPATGGCHFIVDCDRYSKGCTECPVFLESRHPEIPEATVAFRRKTIARLRPFVMGNSHMLGIYRRGPVFQDYDRLVVSYPIIDNDMFHPASPIEKKEIRRCLGLPENAFVMLFGSQIANEHRKGMPFLIEALDRVSRLSGLPSVHLVILGDNAGEIAAKMPFEHTLAGRVPFEELPDLYRASDLFLSPTISDAGPTMVNFALSSGIPTVAFPVGTAIDMISNRDCETGYTALMGDASDFARGIERYLRMEPAGRRSVAVNCRQTALELTSPGGFADRVKALAAK